MDITLPIEPILIAQLPLPPSTNQLYKNIPWTSVNGRLTSRRVATNEYLAFQQEAIYALHRAPVDWNVIEWIRARKSKRQFLPMKLEVMLYLESLYRSDWDNRVKALQDVIFGRFLMLNDSLVTDSHVKKRLCSKGEYCKVRLSFAQDEEDEEW